MECATQRFDVLEWLRRVARGLSCILDPGIGRHGRYRGVAGRRCGSGKTRRSNGARSSSPTPKSATPPSRSTMPASRSPARRNVPNPPAMVVALPPRCVTPIQAPSVRPSGDVRLESAKWAKADTDQVALTNRDFISTSSRRGAGRAAERRPLENSRNVRNWVVETARPLLFAQKPPRHHIGVLAASENSSTKRPALHVRDAEQIALDRIHGFLDRAARISFRRPTDLDPHTAWLARNGLRFR